MVRGAPWLRDAWDWIQENTEPARYIMARFDKVSGQAYPENQGKCVDTHATAYSESGDPTRSALLDHHVEAPPAAPTSSIA